MITDTQLRTCEALEKLAAAVETLSHAHTLAAVNAVAQTNVDFMKMVYATAPETAVSDTMADMMAATTDLIDFNIQFVNELRNSEDS